MLEIKLEQPFSLHMEVVETDDHVPSMRVETKIIITQFQHTLSYQGAFWIECEKWSNFTSALNDSSQDAVLKDMNDYFALTIRKHEHKRIMSWEFKKIGTGNSKSAASFLSEINDDMLGEIRKEFTNFPAWW